MEQILIQDVTAFSVAYRGGYIDAPDIVRFHGTIWKIPLLENGKQRKAGCNRDRRMQTGKSILWISCRRPVNETFRVFFLSFTGLAFFFVFFLSLAHVSFTGLGNHCVSSVKRERGNRNMERWKDVRRSLNKKRL